MPDSKRFLPPETISRISRLDLRARRIVEGLLSGMHRSPYFGQSVEFRQHREYAAGDDLRHVDWKVWARQDRLYVKQYEEDTNLNCYFLVDVSNSMRFGQTRKGFVWTKYDCAATLACCLAYHTLKNQDAVGSLIFDDHVRSHLPPRTRQIRLQQLAESLNVTAPQDKTDLEMVLRTAAEDIPRRGMVVLISDLFAPRDGLFRGLKLLRQRGHDVVVMQVLDDEELDFNYSGPIRFESLETTDFVQCNPRALRDGYLQAFGEFLEEIRRGCGQLGIDYSCIRTGQPLDAGLSAFLRRREMLRSQGK